MLRSIRRWAPLSLATVSIAVLVLILQFRSGAYHAELGGDEASHYVSGLLLHDYLLSGFAMSPRAYLIVYHSHYPLVGLGHWPPLYYLAEAGWMLLFSEGRTAVLLLSATVTLALGIVLYRIMAPRSGRILAAIVAAILVASPVTQGGTSTLMLDVPIALLCLLSMVAYVRYLDSGQTRWSILFSMLAFMAIMTKGNGACLALLPGCTVLLGRRFDLLRKPSFWLPALIVGGLAGPWYVLTYGKVAAGFRYSWGFDYVRTAMVANAQSLVLSVGPVVFVLGILGFLAVVWRPAKRRIDSELLGAASLLASVWIFQSVIPSAIESRYIEPMLPPLLILAVFGFRVLWDRLRKAKPAASTLSWGIGALFGLSFLATSAELVAKPSSGVIQAVQQLIANPIDGNPAVLIAADAAQEAEAVAEVAMQDHNRPNLFAVRGSRLLGGGGYNNQDYLPRFNSAEKAMAAIDSYGIPVVLFRADNGPLEWAHMQQIEQARKLFPDRWQEVGRFAGSAAPVMLFHILANAARPVAQAELIMLAAPRGLGGPSHLSGEMGLGKN